MFLSLLWTVHGKVEVVLSPLSLKTLVLLWWSASLLMGCGAVGFYSGPDRPDNQDLLGPPPPPDFNCEQGSRSVTDSDNDKHPDGVVYLFGGTTLCRGDDTNRDGRVDRWQHYKDGKVVDEINDRNHDGVLDPPVSHPSQ